MTDETVKLTIENGVAIITLSRPDNMNAVNLDACESFCRVAQEASRNDTVRAVLIRAEGKAFCVGGDVMEMSRVSGDRRAHVHKMASALHEGMLHLKQANGLVITEVQGVAAGAGVGLATFADIVLVSDRASFTMAYTAIGLSPDGGATWLLPRLVGLRRAQELLYSNRKLSAQEAVDWGLASQLVPHDDLAEEALATACKMAKGPGRAFSDIRGMLDQSLQNDFRSHLAREAENIAELTVSEDGKEGLSAFLERKEPDFSGR
ncbi:enoyl-CoA hydratase/isomerase family protein [Emcibacter sp.]|uniref:enoyl-CoA hydratase/isomerase family protein n=1 Tax=Emcibacter sp. TaxID=1979954 RepID=UPI002AA89470|nr:enoyl-CoA hydratase-related protein [Emcibacter sp.]